MQPVCPKLPFLAPAWISRVLIDSSDRTRPTIVEGISFHCKEFLLRRASHRNPHTAPPTPATRAQARQARSQLLNFAPGGLYLNSSMGMNSVEVLLFCENRSILVGILLDL